MEPEKKTSKAESIIMYVGLGLTIIFGMIYLLMHDNCSRFNDVWEANIDTRYEVRIQVEDTAYALVDAYNANVSLYEQYRGVDDAKAKAAKGRANVIAVIYNDFMESNTIVWGGSRPTDIEIELLLIE